MADLDIAQTTTVAPIISDYSVNSISLDAPQTEDKYQYFENAPKYFGYYKTIPELKGAIDILAIWTAGKGFTTDTTSKVILEHIDGWGEDTIQSILQNMIIVKKIVGDSFAEIIRNDNGLLLNIKPISPERIRIVISPKGRIKHYEQLQGGNWKKIERENMLHLSNDRLADETHGISVVESCAWVIEALQEARTDYKKVLHRNVVPLRIIEVDSDNTTKINQLKAQYKTAIENGEVLVIPKGTVSITNETIQVQDPIAWINTLLNYFYIAVKVPRVMATSEGYTEAGGKVGFLTFEPIYTNEQTLLEADLWNQLGMKLTFNRPPTLSGVMAEDEQKNAGQLGMQPNDVQAGVGA